VIQRKRFRCLFARFLQCLFGFDPLLFGAQRADQRSTDVGQERETLVVSADFGFELSECFEWSECRARFQAHGGSWGDASEIAVRWTEEFLCSPPQAELRG
jgi:hypothetical protein